jgi:DNA-binding PucR family transcriptional regulator
VENFEKHYRQASAALALGQRIDRSGCVFLYRNYQFYDLLSHVDGSEQLGLFCHPVLGLLRRYDHENGTELYRTLKVYVDSGGSVKHTAEALYVHRNSLMYRLGRIEELGKIDINDPDTSFILKMSFQIDTYAGLDA